MYLCMYVCVSPWTSSPLAVSTLSLPSRY
uniref:Uncharacterized protein n=1 Tax=Anguilla anguilla TaxID=7936 RepID=A0A0E9QK41_ANGAN